MTKLILSVCGRAARAGQPVGYVRLLLLAGLLVGSSGAWAQAPAWQLAIGTNTAPATGNESEAGAQAVDAAGNVFVTGFFAGSVTFGSTRLTSVGGRDIFVAKWDATVQAFTWATSGGGTSDDYGTGIAVRGTGVFVTGTFDSGSNARATNARFAGQALAGAGGLDMFVAKYVDTSTGSTPATSSFANAWATSGGGTGPDQGSGIAVSGTGVFVTGSFFSNTGASIAGQALAGAGRDDMFVAKYVDTSTGSTPATSRFANAWATSGGGAGADYSADIAVSGTGVFVTGSFLSATNASLAGQVLTGAGGVDVFVAKYVDTSTGSTPAASSFANAWATSGGGSGTDEGFGIAVSGTGVFVTGSFGSATNARLAGQALAGAGGDDMFVAKYVDTSTGSTPATSSFANAWATSGGGTSADIGANVAVSGTGVFVTGFFGSATNARLAGQTLAGAGREDVFVAKYVDTSTGSTPATSSFANAWATSGGGPGSDYGGGIAINEQHVYAVGTVMPPAVFGSITFGTAGGRQTTFLARLTDATLPLAGRAEAPAGAGFTLYPNPARGGAITLSGAAPGRAVQVLDALGRPILNATADAEGRAQLRLPTGLAPGLYLVKSGGAVWRLVVE